VEQRNEILKNPLFVALKKVGHEAKDDIFVWSQGLGFHNSNLNQSLKKNVEAQKTRSILTDLWKFFYSVGLEKPNKVLRITENPHIERINNVLNEIMENKDHPAIFEMGDSVEDAILNWVRAFAIYDFAAYTFLEKHLGAKEGLRIYMGLWEIFALAELDSYKKALGIDDTTTINVDILGKLSRAYWESIGCPYKVIQHSPDIHEAEVEMCPYWENMKEILGEEKCRSMTLKTEAATSVNYYDAILKALGVFDLYSFTMDKFACCGDDYCRVRFEKRK